MSFLSNCFGSLSSSSKAISNESPEPEMIKNKPTDEEIIKFENELRSNEAAQGPLVSPLFPLSLLMEELGENQNYSHKIQILSSVHEFGEMRKCRRDGNCFYRAVAFELIEIFKRNPSAAITKYQEAWKEQLKTAKFDSLIFEDFSDAFWSYLPTESDETNKIIHVSTQEAWETDEYTSNMAVMLMRLLTSAQIKGNPDDYLAFIEFGPQDSDSIEKWCERNVVAVGVDADQVQLIALAKMIGISVVVANLGGGLDSDDLQVNEFDFRSDSGPGNDPIINLLYRPGHYDLIYKLKKSL